MGRGDHAHVDLHGTRAANPLQFALLQHTQQLGLEGRRDFADLVEEDGAAVGRFETSAPRRHGSGEGALFVAEQFRFEQVFRQRSAVEAHVRAVGARRMVVDGVGDEFLAGAGFATQQDRGVPFGDHAHLVEHPAHRRRTADDVVEAVLVAHRAAQAVALVGDGFLFPLDIQRQADALADQAGDHLDEARTLGEQTVVRRIRLHRQHAVQVAAEADRRGDERQAPVVQSQPVEKARFVAEARHGQRAFLFENEAEQPFAGLVAHRLVALLLAAADGMDDEVAAFRIKHADHAAAHPRLLVERAQDLARSMAEIQRPGQDLADAIQRLEFDAAQGGQAGQVEFAHATVRLSRP